jgi:hypothetical protein
MNGGSSTQVTIDLVKLALPDAPPTAVMTTNITQVTIDLAMLAGGRGDPNELATARRRASMIRTT